MCHGCNQPFESHVRGKIQKLPRGRSEGTEEELEAVDYKPQADDDWDVSTPAEQELDPMLVAKLYHDAAELEAIFDLLVVKDGYLIAEDYFNQGSTE